MDKRLFSKKLREALRNNDGTIQFKYIKFPEQTIEVNDEANGEHSVTKKSGSCMMMKSGNSHLFSQRSTKLFTGPLDKVPDLNAVKTQEDVDNLHDLQKKLKEQGEKLKDSLVKKNAKIDNPKTSDADAQVLEADKKVIRDKLGLIDSQLKATRIQEATKNREEMIKLVGKAIGQKDELERDQRIAQDKKAQNELDKLERQTSQRNNLGGNNEEKMDSNLNKKFVDKEKIKKYSKAGYSDEREKIVSILLDLRESKTNKDKAKILSGLESIVKNISDNKVNTIVRALIDELNKISVTDSQFDQIVSDAIDNMQNEGVMKLFSNTSVNAITKFYAYGDMYDNPNRQAFMQYKDDRRRQRFDVLKKAAFLGGGGALLYNYLDNNGIQPIMNAGHTALNALSRAANTPIYNGEPQQVSPGAAPAAPAADTTTAVTQAVPTTNNWANSVGDQWQGNAPDGQQVNQNTGINQMFQNAMHQTNIDAANSLNTPDTNGGVNYGDQATVATQEGPGLWDNIANRFHRTNAYIYNGIGNAVNKVGNWFTGQGNAATNSVVGPKTVYHQGTVVDPNDPHHSAYFKSPDNNGGDNDSDDDNDQPHLMDEVSD